MRRNLILIAGRMVSRKKVVGIHCQKSKAGGCLRIVKIIDDYEDMR